MKFVARYVLLLCLLFVGKYGYMQAHAAPYAAGAYVAPVIKEKSTLKAVQLTAENDDELPTDKKKQSDPGNITSAFYAPPVKLFNYYRPSRLAQSKHLVYSSPDRSILYGVFRI
ncbi:hypothetical protein [Polluticoccus soli]|uniref:hypothetical protein n=1 Tax=Polluticoccus soli TaxID=3034150 RepID=UPI0023E27BD1|nr:hypothetical protein [Flavipsychrobacter sp. JY13-12]